MGVKVAKFGGTSVADAAQIRKVQSIILSDEKRCYIVPSAPGKRNDSERKITDLLYICHAHVQQDIPFEEVFQIISDRYREIVSELCLSLNIDSHLAEVKKSISEGASAAHTASRGEYLIGLILSALLDYDFVDPCEIIFFDKYGRLDAGRTQKATSERLKHHERAVIPGFYGTAYNGSIETFPRGGSDITGAIIARGVQADMYENWTDVSGLLMADPNIIDNPKPIEIITYRELRELAYMGANVLHDEAIFPVKEAGIPVRIKNTNRPQDSGTLIVKDAEPGAPGKITGIAGKKDFTVIGIEKALMNSEVGFVRKLLSVLEVNAISFEHLPSGIDTVSVVIENSQLDHKLDKVIQEIQAACNPDSIEVFPDMAIIATVGRGMYRTTGFAAKLFTALGNESIRVRMIDLGSSDINIIVGVETNDFERAVRALYTAFVE